VLFEGVNGSDTLSLQLSNSGAAVLGTFGSTSTLTLGANSGNDLVISSAHAVSVTNGLTVGSGFTVSAGTSAVQALTATTGGFSGAVTGASYSGGAISGTTGAFSALVSANLGMTLSGGQLLASGATSTPAAAPVVVTGTSGNGPVVTIANTGSTTTGAMGIDAANSAFFLSPGSTGTMELFGQLSLPQVTTTTTAPAAGAAAAPPATPAGYMTITVDGVARKVAFY
jgi:hypothetical protein